MLLKMRQSFVGMNFSYRKNDVAEIPDAVAKSWIKSGLAEEADPEVIGNQHIDKPQFKDIAGPEQTTESSESTEAKEIELQSGNENTEDDKDVIAETSEQGNQQIESEEVIEETVKSKIKK